MAINKDNNGYTFLFAIIIIVVVGSGLAALSVGLKTAQNTNVEIKNKMDILGAIKIESTRQNADDLYEKYILSDECLVLDDNGLVKEDVVLGDVDIQKEYRENVAKKREDKDVNYPLYIANVEGAKKFIIPMVGTGLWGPVWGYIAVNDDCQSIYGATYFHKTETPGLGAEISTALFQDQYVDELISEDGVYKKMLMMKDGSGATEKYKVDGITGGTITSKGVEEMFDRTVQVYVDYFNKLKQ